MKRVIIFFAVLAASAGLSYAQNLDPTVEVSRAYEGKLMEVHKPVFEMAVPDTVYRFDLDFDYSVFDNPYKGAYEFRPYIAQMRPSSALQKPSSFYMRAGAGYTLHPVFDILYSPVLKGPFSLNLYGLHKSYIGQYRALLQAEPWNGYDMLSSAGVDLGYDWKKSALDFGVSYYGLATDDYLMKKGYDALDAYLSVRSKMLWSESFFYDISLAYRYAKDHSSEALLEQNILLESSFGPNLKRGAKVLVDVDVELASYSESINETIGRFSFIPKYKLDRERMRVDAGIRVEAVMAGGGYSKGGQMIYPDVRAEFAVIPDAMRFFIDVTGGERLNTYASMLAANHHLNMTYAPDGYLSLMQSSVERVNARLGVEGRISAFFSYNLSGGYANSKRELWDAVMVLESGEYKPAIGYSPCQKAFAAVGWEWNMQNFKFDGTLKYTHVWDMEDGKTKLVAPSAFSGNVAATYNWNKRIYAGVDCELASSRTAGIPGSAIPGYADLGINAEYVMNRMISFWVRGGNLLNMEIQRNVFFAEKGINFTAGICLNL